MMDRVVYKVKYFDFLKERKLSLFILAHDMECAFFSACGILDAVVGEESWQLLEVQPKRKIKLINATIMGEEDNHDGKVDDSEFSDYTCPKCQTVNHYPTGMEKIICSKCKKEIKIESELEGEK